MKKPPDSSLYETPAHDRTGRTLLWAMVAAFAVRLVVVGFVYQGFLDPGRDHWEFAFETGRIARSIIAGHGFGNLYYRGDTGPTAMVAPVLPYLLAGVMLLFGVCTKAAALAMLTLNSLFSALTCVPIFLIAKKSFGVWEARWATWIWVFFPYAVYFSAADMWNHSLTALLLSLLFLTALHLEDSTRLWAWAGFGFLGGGTALVNPVVLGTLPFLGGWVCYRLRRKKIDWTPRAAIAGLAILVALAPWLIRNYRVFHRPVLLNGFPLVFTVSNVGNTLHWWNPTGDPPGNAAEMAEFRRMGEQAYMAEKWRQMFAFIKSNPGTVLWRSLRRFVYMWTGYWSFRREYLHEERFDPPNIVLCTTFTALAMVGLRQAWRRAPDLALPYGLLLLVFPPVYYFTSSTMAYRHPLDPEMVILVSCAVLSWLRAREGGRSRPRLRRTDVQQVEAPDPMAR